MNRVERVGRVMARMAMLDVDVLLVSVGADLPWLIGYEAMPLERLTMLVLGTDGTSTLVVPRLEAPRVEVDDDVFALRPWNETEDPIAVVAELIGNRASIAIDDRTWARFVLDLQRSMPAARWRRGSEVTGPLRAVKDQAEIDALRIAGAAADRVATQLQEGAIRLVGRTEAEVSADIGRRLLDEGHDRVNFAIVASGPNAASPHHDPGGRTIQAGELVLCDFGGTMNGYCSDITRCVHTGPLPADVNDAYVILREAQAAAVAGAIVGRSCEEVDAVARGVITDAGYGEAFMHRTGHGIGCEEHEDPYIVAGNATRLEPGHAFSIEPGIYLQGRWGMRLEDIVIATADGPLACNTVEHDLVVV
jgi:Xaa-Pro aminopeptidase